MPNMKELTFDSGLGAATREIPIDVVLAVLEDAKSLQRFDLCDVNITCQGLIDVNQQVSRLESSSTSKVQQALSQVCIDRCYFVQDNDPVNINELLYKGFSSMFQPANALVLSLTINSTSSIVVSIAGLVLVRIWLISIRAADNPSFMRGWRNVVSAGMKRRAMAMSSNPTTETSPGTEILCRASSEMKPNAI